MKEEKISNTATSTKMNNLGSEDSATKTQDYKLEFFGKGSEFFKITIVTAINFNNSWDLFCKRNNLNIFMDKHL